MNELERAFVTSLYQGFLGREPDEGGLNYWGGVLANARPLGKTVYAEVIENVLGQFEGSAEFAQVMANMIALAPPDPVPSVDVDINGNPIPDPTGPAGAQMGQIPGNPPFAGSGPGPCGAYQVALGNASAGMTGENAITTAWLYILEDIQPGSPRLGNSIHIGIARNHAFAFKFRTGPVAAFPSIVAGGNAAFTLNSEEQYTHGPLRPRFVVISQKIWDFDYSKIGVDGAYVAMQMGSGVLGQITDGSGPAVTFPFATLLPSTDYYISMRFEDASSPATRGVLSADPSIPYIGQTIGIQCNG